MYRTPTQEAINHLVGDLAVDHYLTDDQLFTRYGMGAHAVKALNSLGIIRRTRTHLRPTHGARKTVPVTIISSPRSRKNPLAVIGMEHYLGLAELRWAMRDRFTSWRAAVKSRKEPHYFDVIAFDERGEVLVEFDSGRHDARRLSRKVEIGHAMARRQLWGTPSASRARLIMRLAPDAEVWQVRWHDGTCVCIRPAPPSPLLASSAP